MSFKIQPQHMHEFLILKGIQATKQEVTNELNSKEEEQSMDETMLNRMLHLSEENAQLRNELLSSRNELLASKDEQIKSMKTIGELSCENVQLKEQLSMAKETIKDQGGCIDQLEEEKSQQQQEMNDIKLSTQQQQLDNATKQNNINDMEKQLHQTKEELKEAQEKHTKTKEELIQKQLELDNCTKEVEQQKEELSNYAKEVGQQKEELDNRKKEVEQLEEKLNNCMEEVEQERKRLLNMMNAVYIRERRLIEEHAQEMLDRGFPSIEDLLKQGEYDELINILSKALSDYGTYANYVIEESYKNSSIFSNCKWTAIHQRLSANYTSIREYLDDELMCNDVSKEKKLLDTIVVYKNN